MILVVNQSQLAAYLPTNFQGQPKVQFIKTININQKPITIDWKLLMDIEYKLEYNEAFEMEIYNPIFTDALKGIDGKEVIIKGYVIPIDDSGNLLALSANPYASCFFCGNASPASVIGMNLKKKKRYKMDASIKFQGVLKLNYDDPEEFYYVLENAVSVK